MGYVEDDLLVQKKTLSLLKNFFNEVDTADNGEEGFIKYEDFHDSHRKYYDIVITDIRMPKQNGLELSKDIFNLNPRQIVMVTSAHDDAESLIEFINIGIKRFIKKPFTTMEIIDSLLYICNLIDVEIENRFIDIEGGFQWDVVSNALYKDQVPLKLSFNETVILDTLIMNKGQIFSNSDLFTILKVDSINDDISVDSIKSIIKRLRKKVPPELILNIYGQGYKINKDLFDYK